MIKYSPNKWRLEWIGVDEVRPLINQFSNEKSSKIPKRRINLGSG